MDRLYSGWLDLQVVGFVLCVVTFYWLEGDDKSERLLAALSHGRRGVLKETCLSFGSTSGRARLVRLALRLDTTEVSPEPRAVDYRSSPAAPTPSPTLARSCEAELRRLRVGVLLGAFGVVAMLAPSVAMLSTPGFVGVGVASALVALALGYKVVSRWRRTTRALRGVYEALPAIVAQLDPPAPLATTTPSGQLVDLSSRSGGFLRFVSALFTFGMSFIAVTVVAVILSRTTTRIGGGEVMPTFLLFAFLGVPLLVLGLTAKHRVEVHAAERELVVVHRRFWVIRTRTVVPLELIEGFAVRISGGRGRIFYVVATIGPEEGDRIDLGECDDDERAREVVATLTTSLIRS